MPGFIAKKLCPDLVIVGLNFRKYRGVSEQVREILRSYDPNFCSVGLDESYLDLTEYVKKTIERDGRSVGYRHEEGCGESWTVAQSVCVKPKEEGVSYIKVAETNPGNDNSHRDPSEITHSAMSDSSCFPSTTKTTVPASLSGGQSSNDVTVEATPTPSLPDSLQEDMNVSTSSNPGDWCLPPSHWECAKDVVKEMRARIVDRTGLTASAGIAPNMMLAKVASDLNKPNGQCFVVPTREGVLEFVRKLPIRKVSELVGP